jgi:starch phosphorylase
MAKDIAQWKENVAERWDGINVVSSDTSVLTSGGETGKEYTIQYVIDEQGLNDAVGLELVSLKNDMSGTDREINKVTPFKMIKQEGNLYTFECKLSVDKAGAFKTCVRMYPKNDQLPHRQDFCYIKWLD